MSVKTYDNLDFNKLDTATDPLDVRTETCAAMQIGIMSGAGIAATVVTCEGSIDGQKWYAAGATLAAEGVTAVIDVRAFAWIRGRVSTAAGAALTGSISFVTKRE